MPNKPTLHLPHPYRGKSDRARASSTQRGYGPPHPQWRKLILARDPICKMCGVAPATEADHKDGDNTNFLMANGQGLCKGCHSLKTVLHNGGFGNERS